jgi:hypothetical protein
MTTRTRTRYGAAAAVAIALAVGCGAEAAPDSLYRAGMMNGHYLYWVPRGGLQFDTLDFGAVAAGPAADRAAGITSPEQAAAFFRSTGKTLCRVKKPCAMAVLTLLDQGLGVLALTQWHASPTRPVLVPKPGMIQEAMRHTILSDVLWAAVQQGMSEDMTAVQGDLRVRFRFSGGGMSDYGGRDNIIGTSEQVLGTEGLTVEVKEADYKEDMNVQRTIYAIFVVLPKETRPSDAVAGIEKAMDRRKLDLSYPVPEIIPVR